MVPLAPADIPELQVVTLGSCFPTVEKEHILSSSPVLGTLLPSQTLDWNAVKQEREMLLDQSLPKMASAPGTQLGVPTVSCECQRGKQLASVVGLLGAMKRGRASEVTGCRPGSPLRLHTSGQTLAPDEGF